MVICLERCADLHMSQLMPLPLTVYCFTKTQIGFTFLVPAHPGSPGKRAVKRVCVCVLSTEINRICFRGFIHRTDLLLVGKSTKLVQCTLVASGAAMLANVGLCPASS